uniref:Uncharacterized protein n=1 Tax=Arundo donax TaxID=35708 RepID=A0A0A9FAG3_ARUDO
MAKNFKVMLIQFQHEEFSLQLLPNCYQISSGNQNIVLIFIQSLKHKSFKTKVNKVMQVLTFLLW